MNKQTALQVGQELAQKIGVINISNASLSDAMGVPSGSLPHILGCSFTEFFDELKSVCPPTNHEVLKKRVNPALRKDHILNTAVELAVSVGYTKITRPSVAVAAGVSESTIQKHFSTMVQLRNDLVRRAVKTKNLAVIAQAIAAGSPHVKKLDADLREKALETVGA